MMHPFAEGNVVAARRDAAKVVQALREAIVTKDSAEVWKLVADALGLAAGIEAQLRDALTLDEMAVITGEEAGA